MSWFFRGALILVVASLASGCYEMGDLESRTADNEARIQALHDFAALLTVDNDPATTPGSSEDPAYLLLQSRAICALAEYIEGKHTGSNPNDRPQFLKDLCGPPATDPVYPPPFPPPPPE